MMVPRSPVKTALWDKCCDACSLNDTHCCVCVCFALRVCTYADVCACVYACAVGLFDVVVLVHFKGEALMRILQNSGRGGGL